MGKNDNTQECILTGHWFRPKHPDDVISPQGYKILSDAIVELIKSDSNFRQEMMTAILCDEQVTSSVARSLMSVKAKDAGLVTSGSIADLFCKLSNKSSKKKTGKTGKEVEAVHRKESKKQ